MKSVTKKRTLDSKNICVNISFGKRSLCVFKRVHVHAWVLIYA